MFRIKPKHTVESVTRQLIHGLDEGTIVLRHQRAESVCLEDLQHHVQLAIVSSRRKAIFLQLTSLLTVTSATVLAIVALLMKGRGLGSSHPTLVVLSLIAAFVTIFAVLVVQVHVLVRTRELASEMKTFRHVLKVADQKTAERLAPRVERKLRRRRQTAL